MTHATDQLAIGWVDKFDVDRGYGFVSPMLAKHHPVIGDAGSVFIHASQCRVFAGSPEQPEIQQASRAGVAGSERRPFQKAGRRPYPRLFLRDHTFLRG